MKKSLIVMLCCLMLNTLSVAYAESNGMIEKVEYPITVNNNYHLNIKNSLLTINDNLYVPLREFSENLGIGVEWDEENKRVELSIFSNDIRENGIDGTIRFPIMVSMIDLISNPYKYHEKYIRLFGVGNIEFEDNAIYLTKDDWFYFNSKNSIWIKIGDNFCKPIEEAKLLNGQYVEITGRFNATQKGHMASSSGGIEDVQSYVKAYSRDDYAEMDGYEEID